MSLPAPQPHPDKPPPDTVEFRLGRILGTGLLFTLTLAMLKVGMICLGGSGSGKSNFFEALVRCLLKAGESFTFIDPHGDTATRLMAFVLWLIKKIGRGLIKTVHFLEISPRRAFAFDPAAKLPGRSEVGKADYDSLLKALVDRITACILRRVPEADQVVMNRLKRWLKNVVYACTVDFLGNNTHVGLHKALVFTNPDHPEFPELIGKVLPYLPDYVQADFRALMDTGRAIDREKWVESTINRLRDLLSPLLELIFSQQAPSINIYQIIRSGECIIASFPKSSYLSHDQKVTIIGLLIEEILSAKQVEEQALPEHLRRRHTLIVDEAGEVIGEDLKLALGAVRKYKLIIVLGAQNLDKLALGDLQAGAETMSECKMKVVFQLQEDENVQKVTKDIGHGNIDYTERQTEVQRQRGFIEHKVEEHSFGEQASQSGSEGGSSSRTDTDSVTKAKGTASGSSWSNAQAHAEGGSQVNTNSTASGASLSPTGAVENRSSNQNRSNATSVNVNDTTTNSQGGSATVNESEAHGKSTAIQNGQNWSKAQTEGKSHGITFKTMLLANMVSAMEPNGQLAAGPENAQWGKLLQKIHGQNPGEAMVKTPERPDCYQVKFDLVQPVWHGSANDAAAEVAKKVIMESKPYFFSPEAIAQPQPPHPLDIPRPEADAPLRIEHREKKDENPLM